jgi:hypothetical protein
MDELRQTSTQLNHAVQGLNELMEEALRVAGQAAHSGRPEEIAAIFDDATAHLKRATVTPKQLARRRHHSIDELRHEAHLPAPVSRWDQPARRHTRQRVDEPAELHHLGLPPALNRAYLTPDHRSQPMRRHARPRLDDPVELHYRDFPIRPRQYLRDERRPERVRAKVPNVPARPPIESIAKPLVPLNRIAAPPDAMTDSSSTSHGSSNATTISADKLDLKHPRKRHISIPANQDVSLGRHHHRQPIAREWPMLRKRITAMIACLNTVFIGLIVGIYVSFRISQ